MNTTSTALPKAINLHAPFALHREEDGPYEVRDAEGVLVGTTTTKEFAAFLAVAANEIAQKGRDGHVEVTPKGHVLSLRHDHPQGGVIEVSIPTDVPGAGPDYFDIAVRAVRSLCDTVERVARDRKAGRIAQA